MTGKELIIYILTNNLENEVVLRDGYFMDFMDEQQAAVKFNVGAATIRTWHEYGMLPGTKIGNSIFFLKDVIKKER